MEQTTFSYENTASHLYFWLVDKPKAIILLIHGHGEYGERYSHMAEAFNEAGISAMAMDLYGHGRSEGKKGHIPTYDKFLTPVSKALGIAQEKAPGVPVFIHGHSMGGNIVASYVMKRNPENLTGVILSSAYFRLAFKPTPVQLMLARVGKVLMPALTQPSNLDTKGLSRDAEEVNKYDNDPLIHGLMSAQLYSEINQHADFVLSNATHWSLPVLISHGDADPVTSYDTSKELFDSIPDSTDKTWKPMAGNLHEPHNDYDRAELIGAYRDWMLARV